MHFMRADLRLTLGSKRARLLLNQTRHRGGSAMHSETKPNPRSRATALLIFWMGAILIGMACTPLFH